MKGAGVVVVLVAGVILGACAEQREEIIETNVPLYMEAGAPSGSASGGAGGGASAGGSAGASDGGVGGAR